jgi:hypothetical protein
LRRTCPAASCESPGHHANRDHPSHEPSSWLKEWVGAGPPGRANYVSGASGAVHLAQRHSESIPGRGKVIWMGPTEIVLLVLAAGIVLLFVGFLAKLVGVVLLVVGVLLLAGVLTVAGILSWI